jgi:hypothetical protein
LIRFLTDFLTQYKVFFILEKIKFCKFVVVKSHLATVLLGGTSIKSFLVTITNFLFFFFFSFSSEGEVWDVFLGLSNNMLTPVLVL